MNWKKVSERIEKVGYKRVTFKDFELPGGTISEYTTWGTATNNAAIIALTEDSKVVIAQQFRPGPERILYELPGGGVEQGEDPAEAARRELLEETGYTSEQPIEFIGTGCRDAYTNETNYYYLITGCRKVSDQSLDENEHVTITEITITEMIKNAKTAQMSDGIAVLMAYERLKALNG